MADAPRVPPGRRADIGPRAELPDERRAIELCLLVGHYEMLATTINALGIQPER